MSGALNGIGRVAALVLLMALDIHSTSHASDVVNKTLPDGVVHWHRSAGKAEPPAFVALLKDIAGFVVGEKEPLYGQSVAFLVGVDSYVFLKPQLAFVRRDIDAMRTFLLTKGGFDEVYILTGDNARVAIVQEYLLNVFRHKLKPKDRFLFYFSGHGAELEGSTTGYMQFRSAKAGDFANDVLAISDSRQWASILPASHKLFVFDCCASGLAFTSKGNLSLTQEYVARTLAGTRSSVVITAGAGEQEAISVGADGQERSLFTDVLLDGLATGRADFTPDGVITVDELFTYAATNVELRAKAEDKRMTPRIWRLDQSQESGTFLFLNTSHKGQFSVLAETSGVAKGNHNASIQQTRLALRQLDDWLINAVQVADYAAVEAAIIAGADVNATSASDSPLYAAVAFGAFRDPSSTIRIIDLLLAHDADVNLRNSTLGQAPLHIVGHLWGERREGRGPNAKVTLLATEDAERILRRLLGARGVKVNITDHKFETPLHSAVGNNAVRAVEILLEDSRVDVNAKNEDSETALCLANNLSYVSNDIIRFLQKKGGKCTESEGD